MKYRGYYLGEQRNYFEELAWCFCQLIKDLAIFILGIILVAGGYYINQQQDMHSKEVLIDFLKGFNDASCYDFSEKDLVRKDISVKIEADSEAYRTYWVEVTSGNYSFKGKVYYGEFIESIEYTKNENFWDIGTMMTFGGLIFVFLGLGWCVFKRSMGLHSVRELYDVGWVRAR